MEPTAIGTAARLGGSALNALRQPKIRVVRLGSREERREVYTQYAAAAATFVYMATERAALYRSIAEDDRTRDHAGITTRIDVQMGDHIRATTINLLHAQFEVELVGTDVVLQVVKRVDAETKKVISHRLPDDVGRLKPHTDAVNEAIDEFIATCRAELWYTPRWWQVHRRLLPSLGRLFRR